MRIRALVASGCCVLGAAILAVVGCGSAAGPKIQADLDRADAIRSALRRAAGAGDEEGGEEKVIEPTGFATLVGRIRFEGTVPSPKQLRVDKDVEVCRPGGQPVLSQEFVVNSENRGLKNVLIFVSSKIPSGDPKWEHESYLAQREALLAGEKAFDQKACRFLSHVYAMRSTQTLEIINSDPVGHNVKIDPPTTKVASTNVTVPANGGKATWKPGGESNVPVSVACNIHPWMSAYILPRDNPFFAVTDENGGFRIDYVPAGVELEFRIWQERIGFVSGSVTLNGQAVKLSKGRIKKVKLEPDQETSWEFVFTDALLD